jgi:hypothetical protein
MVARLAVKARGPSGVKFEISLERKVEAAWEQAQQAGWSYSHFIRHLFAILIVLRQRDRWVANAASPQKKRKPKKKDASVRDGHASLVAPS